MASRASEYNNARRERGGVASGRAIERMRNSSGDLRAGDADVLGAVEEGTLEERATGHGAAPASGLFDRLLSRVEDVAIILSALALAAIMTVVVLDVVLRYGFNAPLLWAYELVANYLIPVAFFFAIAQTLRFNEHICVDLFVEMMGARTRHAVLLIGFLMSLVLFVALTFLFAGEAWKSYAGAEFTVGYFVWPIWPAKAAVFAGFLLLSLRVLVRIHQEARGLLRASCATMER